ncbi:MAG: 5-(carboxyamino)imidazole ribonucleotide synthase [Paracoccaceae bacterium]|jgi:5-(carboxyamino)imidazole ribonucleotide synthase|tara:strand:- start:197 stop:1264 length:1068 start_codon:yes stop_codon:yes gene_type:complete
MNKTLISGSTIGILGGGQLGQMLSMAAARLGFKTHIFEPSENPPASNVASKFTRAEYDDYDALKQFASSVDVVTYEFENIPTAALDIIETQSEIFPNREALKISQDRLIEKEFINKLGFKTASFCEVNSIEELIHAINQIGAPSILKTRRFGYDGKGQVKVQPSSKPEEIWKNLGEKALILEGFINFSSEFSVIGSRSKDGQISCFDPGENVHKDGILRTTTVPAHLTNQQKTEAVLITAKILETLKYVGVIGIEFFLEKNSLVINEFAPRVHNSGHWTQNGCTVDQFEQHIRAITGWKLGNAERHSDVIMENLIGDEIYKTNQLVEDGSIALHLYGKADVNPGRKMGHFNRIKK